MMKTAENVILHYAYAIFLGVLLALFVGVGIAAFYPGPQRPEQAPYSAELELAEKQQLSEATVSAGLLKRRVEYEREFKVFMQQNQIYNRNVSSIALVGAVIMLVTSLVLADRIRFLTDGFLLGSILTLLYSIILGFESADEKFRFLVVAVGLLISLTIGYLKFAKQE